MIATVCLACAISSRPAMSAEGYTSRRSSGGGNGSGCIGAGRCRRNSSTTTIASCSGTNVIARRRMRSGSVADRAHAHASAGSRDHDLHLVQSRTPRRGSGGRRRRTGSTRRCRRRALEEALGPEALGLRIDVGAPVREVDVRRDARAGRDLVAGELDRRGELADHARHDRPDPQRLLDHGVEVLAVLLARVELVLQPRQLRRGRAAAARSAQASAVAVVSWPATSSVISSSRSSSSVSALPSSSRACSRIDRTSSRSSTSAGRAAPGDLVVDHRRRPRRAAAGSRSQMPRPIGAAHLRHRDRRQRAALHADVEHRASRSPRRASRSASSMPNTVRMMISSVISCVRGRSAERLAHGPRRDLALGDLAHQRRRSAACARRGRRAASACAGACARGRRAAARSCGRSAARAASRSPRRRAGCRGRR